MNIIKKIPIPICGLMFAIAALATILQSYSNIFKIALSVIALIIFIAFTLKIIFFFNLIKENMNNPVLAGIFGTYPMTLMLLSSYAEPFIGVVAKITWLIAIAIHVALIIFFTIKFVWNFNIRKVFTSYFVVYVGIAMAAVTEYAFAMPMVGILSFWFAFITFVILFFVIGYRYIRYWGIPEQMQPLFCIFAAPASLCLVAYFNVFDVVSVGAVMFLSILGTVLYLISLIKLITLVKMSFVPNFSSFTFPFVISAMAMRITAAYLAEVLFFIPTFLSLIVIVEIVIATFLVIYVLVEYVIYLISKKEKAIPVGKELHLEEESAYSIGVNHNVEDDGVNSLDVNRNLEEEGGNTVGTNYNLKEDGANSIGEKSDSTK